MIKALDCRGKQSSHDNAVYTCVRGMKGQTAGRSTREEAFTGVQARDDEGKSQGSGSEDEEEEIDLNLSMKPWEPQNFRVMENENKTEEKQRGCNRTRKVWYYQRQKRRDLRE